MLADIIIGYIAGSLIMIANILQIKKMIHNKSVEGLSLPYFLLFLIISLMYVVTGFLGNVIYLFVTNLISTIQQIIMIFLYFHYKKKNILLNEENLEENL